MRRLFLLQLAGLLALSSLPNLHAQESRVVIVKADDVAGIAPKWQRFFELSQKNGIKVTAGLIGRSLQKGGEPYSQWLHDWEKSGQVEFWHHGWDHARWEDKGVKRSEFGGSGFAHQKDHLHRTQRDAIAFLKSPFTTFGSPFNAMDADTMKALNEMPELQRIFIRPRHPLANALSNKKILLEMHLVGEHDGVGKPNFEKFKADYSKRISQKFHRTALQFHPNLFSDSHFEEYQKIIVFLKSEGWQFILAKDVQN